MLKLPKLSKMSKRERLMGIVGIAVLSIVLTDRLVLSPWWKFITNVRKESVKLEQEISQQRKLLSRKRDVMADVKKYEKFLRPGDSPEVEMAAFLREIENLSSTSGVTLLEIRPLKSASTDLYQEYGLEVHYQCELENWVGFIHAIENSSNLLLIKQAALSLLVEGKDMLKGYVRIRRLALIKGYVK